MEQSLREKLIEIGTNAKNANRELAKLSTLEKNNILKSIKSSIISNLNEILEANKIDMENGKKSNLTEGLLDRLMLNEDRIKAMASSVDDVIDLDDPIGKVSDMKTLENGLMLGRKTVPMGVIAIIYEARPNVTLDAAILAIKSSNSLILRGGKEAINSNIAIANAIRKGIKDAGYNENIVNLIEDTSRESSTELMKLRGYIDLLIPRGSSRLINSVIENSKVPTLETGVGNCHVFVDVSADIDMAINIIENSKTQRIGVCNAMESLLVHKDVPKEFYDKLNELKKKYSIKVHGDSKISQNIDDVIAATDEDYATEYLDYEFSAKVVSDLDEALDHIYKYSTKHSDVIVTKDYNNSLRFLNEVDSACVYVNASSRFTDGGAFGFGAEMGISTQKLHARGPVGLEQLTSTKYVIFGQGQVRG